MWGHLILNTVLFSPTFQTFTELNRNYIATQDSFNIFNIFNFYANESQYVEGFNVGKNISTKLL